MRDFRYIAPTSRRETPTTGGPGKNRPQYPSFRHNPLSYAVAALPTPNNNPKFRATVYDRDPPCLKCRVPGSPDVQHYHNSSEFDRELSIKDGIDSFHCFVCGMDHPVKTPNRRKILFTSSTLINFWKVDGFFPAVHFEVEAVVGARVRDLTMVFKKRYWDKEEPMDVVICCGINNVGEKQAESDTLNEFATFQNEIYAHSATHKHIEKGHEKNTVSLLPIIIPSKFASFLSPQNIPPNFDNKLKTIQNLNSAIVDLNRGSGEPTVIWTNTYGIRNKAKKKSHRWSSWAERD